MKINIKNKKSIYILFILGIVLLNGCEEEHPYGTKPNSVVTLDSSNLAQTSATVSGNIVSDGDSALKSRGICWNTSPNPTISNFKAANSYASLGNYNCNLVSLKPNTIYYAKAYATNGNGTAYGKETSFKTLPASLPVITSTTSATNIKQTTASSGGIIASDGAATIIARGVCWRTTSNPTIANSKTTDGTGIGTFNSLMSGLLPSTTYYVKAYATNSVGTAYGNEIIFTTTALTIPTGITTNTLSSITYTTALGGGNITDDGGAAITSRGVCWSSTTTNPTISNSKTIDGSGIGSFSSSLTGLAPGTAYYVRAYATNSVGTAYGAYKSFTTTSATLPTGITTNTVSSITQTTASGGGSISGDGGSAIISRGICWSSTTSSPTISNSKTIDGSGIGSFSSSLTGLAPGTTYYVRAYATNSVGTAYGTAKSFTTTSATVPTGITTNSISSIAQTTASSGGSISGDGGSAITFRGVCWSSSNSSPTISNSKTIDGSGIGSFTSSLIGLTAGTTYYVRAYARTNGAGTAYGTVKSFTTTSATIPTGIATNSISSIAQTTASGGGSVSGDGGSTITSKGVCWSSSTSSPTISNSKIVSGFDIGSFTSSLSGLTANTTYYVRAYATNSVGTAYGNVVSFKTLANLTIGQSSQGGIIAYIFQSGDSGYVAGETHGLIVTTANQSTGATWGCSGTPISTSTAIGAGQSNTTAIVNGCSTSGIAAKICDNLSLGSYTDWYLPSYNELNKLFINRLAIGGFTTVNYWSSSQSSSTNAYSINLNTGAYSLSSKNSIIYVRAVRKF